MCLELVIGLCGHFGRMRPLSSDFVTQAAVAISFRFDWLGFLIKLQSDWLTGLGLTEMLTDWLTGWLTWLTSWTIWVIDWLDDWTDRLICTGWLTELTDSFTHSADWLTDGTDWTYWMTCCLYKLTGQIWLIKCRPNQFLNNLLICFTRNLTEGSAPRWSGSP